MKQKIISLPATLFLAFLLLPFTLTGCSGEPGQELKDSVLSSFNDLLHSVSRLALTSDGRLTGERTLGEDNYTGSYQADYEDFYEATQEEASDVFMQASQFILEVECYLHSKSIL